MRKKEAMLNLRRRHHSVVSPDQSVLVLPLSVDTNEDQEFETANPGASPAKIRTERHSKHGRNEFSKHLDNELVRGKTVNENTIQNFRPRDTLESKAESKRGSQHVTRQEEKWKVFLNPPKIQAEVYTHNIFSNEQKEAAKEIYKKRLDTYMQVRKELAPHLQTDDVLNLGHVYKLLLKENPGLLLKKRNQSHFATTTDHPLPPVLSRSRSPLGQSKNELELFNTFINKKSSVQVTSLQ